MDEPLYFRMAERVITDLKTQESVRAMLEELDREKEEIADILGAENVVDEARLSQVQVERMIFHRGIIDAYCHEKGYDEITTYSQVLLNDNLIAYGRPDAEEGIRVPAQMRSLEYILGNSKDFLAAIKLADDADFRAKALQMYRQEVFPAINQFVVFWEGFAQPLIPKN